MEEELENSNLYYNFLVGKIYSKDLSLKLAQEIRLLENKRRTQTARNKFGTSQTAKGETQVDLKPAIKTETPDTDDLFQNLDEYYSIREQEKTLEQYDARIMSYFKTIYINSFHFNIRRAYVQSTGK